MLIQRNLQGGGLEPPVHIVSISDAIPSTLKRKLNYIHKPLTGSAGLIFAMTLRGRINKSFELSDLLAAYPSFF